MANLKTLFSKKILIIAIPMLIIVIVCLVIFSKKMNFPQVSGTMGGVDDGVQKANKYRSEQMTNADVVLKNPEFQNIIQSDSFQKLLKNDNFVKFAADGKLTALTQGNFMGLVTDVHFVQLFSNQSFQQTINNQTFNQLAGLSKFTQLILDKTVVTNLLQGAFNKVEASQSFQNMVNSGDFQKTNLSQSQVMGLFQSESFKNVITSQQFQALATNQSFALFMSNGSNVNLLPKAEILGKFVDAGLAQLVQQPGFSNMVMSQQFMNLAQQGNLQMLNRQ